MVKARDRILILCLLLFSACSPQDAAGEQVQVLTVYASPSTQPWLPDLYACAPDSLVLQVVLDDSEADLRLQLGEPDLLSGPAYQIGSEEILVVTHRQSLVQNTDLEGVRELFAGQGDPSVGVWVFAPGEDVQQVFVAAVMQGSVISTQARLAVSPQHMSDTLNNQPNSLGLLPRRWKVGDSRFVFSLPEVPVLVLVREEPGGAVSELIACTQN